MLQSNIQLNNVGINSVLHTKDFCQVIWLLSVLKYLPKEGIDVSNYVSLQILASNLLLPIYTSCILMVLNQKEGKCSFKLFCILACSLQFLAQNDSHSSWSLGSYDFHQLADHCFKKIKVFTGPSIETFQELKLQSIEGNLNITLEVGIMTEALGDAVFYFYVFLEL